MTHSANYNVRIWDMRCEMWDFGLKRGAGRFVSCPLSVVRCIESEDRSQEPGEQRLVPVFIF